MYRLYVEGCSREVQQRVAAEGCSGGVQQSRRGGGRGEEKEQTDQILEPLTEVRELHYIQVQIQ